MQQRVTITIVGILSPPLPDHADREPGFIEALSHELSRHFPEFKPDPERPMVTVEVEEIQERVKA